MSDASLPVASPCIGQCCLDEQEICLGCFRSLSEIVAWSQASDQQRRAFRHNAIQRRHDSEGLPEPNSLSDLVLSQNNQGGSDASSRSDTPSIATTRRSRVTSEPQA